MSNYWKNRPQYQPPAPHSSSPTDSELDVSFLSEFDRHRLTLVTQGVDEEWQLELRRYLQDVPTDVTRDTDIVAWWSVSAYYLHFSSWHFNDNLALLGSC